MTVESTQEKITRALGCISGARGILRATPHFVDVIAVEYLEDAATTLRGVLVGLESKVTV